MEYDFLCVTGLIIVAILMLPNIWYALRRPGVENKCKNRPLLVLEQIGRYGCILLMILPLGVGKFGFSSAEAFILWCAAGLAMLIGYFVCWIFYFRKPSLPAALWLAILPSAIFILRGVFLRHWLLTVFGVLFAAGHIYITWFNHKT